MKTYYRKPSPSPPKWYWLDSDNCYWCKYQKNCNNCKVLKGIKHQKEKKEKREWKKRLSSRVKEQIDY